jgi:hypothetical protein
VEAVQTTSEELDFEDQLNEVPTRLLQRQYALNSLQYLPRAIAHANSPDDVFWAQEEVWEQTGEWLTQGRNDIVAEEDREAQIELLMRHTTQRPSTQRHWHQRSRHRAVVRLVPLFAYRDECPSRCCWYSGSKGSRLHSKMRAAHHPGPRRIAGTTGWWL